MRNLLSLAIGMTLAVATPAVSAATCAELEAWAARIDKRQVWTLNSLDARLRLYEAFRAPEFAALFGKPALELGDADVQAAAGALGRCAQEARAARRTAQHKQLAGAQAEFTRRLAPLLVQVRNAHAQRDASLAALEALPPSRALLRSLDTLRYAGTDKDLRPGTAIPEGRQLVGALARLPQEAAVEAQPRLAALHARVRDAVLDEAVSGLAATPATVAGVGALEQSLRTMTYELGPALDSEGAALLEQTATARRAAIVAALLAEAEAVVTALPDSVDGARELPSTVQRLSNELRRIADAAALATLERAAQAKRERIEAALVADAKAAVDAMGEGVAGLAALQGALHLPAMQALSPAGRDAVIAHARERRGVVLEGLITTAGAQPATSQGLGALAGMLRDPGTGYLDAGERARLHDAVLARRRAIADELLAAPIAKLATFEANLDGTKALVTYRNETLARLGQDLAAVELAPFEDAYGRHLARTGDGALSAFEKALAKLPDEPGGIAAIKQMLDDVGGGTPAIQQAAATRRRAIQHRLAITAVDEMCGPALAAAKVSKSDARLLLLGQGGSLMTLGELACRLEATEQKLNEYASPRLFGKEHLLKVTTAQGAYLTYTLHEAEVAHGKKALVGFKVADANVEKPLSVDEWQASLAMLMPFDDGGLPPEAECEALFANAGMALSAPDRARMLSCLLALARPQQ